MSSTSFILVDPEISSLIPPLSEDEKQRLRQSLVAEGVRDHLTTGTWSDLAEPVLLDGHNRYAFCKELTIPWQTQNLEFESKNEAILWVINNQLGRRNLCDLDRIALASKSEELETAQALKRKEASHVKMRGPDGKIFSGPVHLNDNAEETTKGKVDMNQVVTGSKGRAKDKTARRANVSRPTYERGKEILDKGSNQLQEAVRAGDLSISAAAELTEFDREQQDKILEQGESAIKAARQSLKLKDCATHPISTEDVLINGDKPETQEINEDSVPTREWLETLPLAHLLPSELLPIFYSDAALWRSIKGDIEELKAKWSKEIKKVGKKSAIGCKIKSLLSVKHPRTWVLCPPYEKGGCNGKGKLAALGTCNLCKGRGYNLY